MESEKGCATSIPVSQNRITENNDNNKTETFSVNQNLNKIKAKENQSINQLVHQFITTQIYSQTKDS